MLVECMPEYHSLFEAVSYAKPIAPGGVHSDIIDPQIWPARYEDFRQSGKTWAEFVYGLNGDRHVAIDYSVIVFDRPADLAQYKLPRDFNVICPFGYSQRRRFELAALIKKADQLFGLRNTYIMTNGDFRLNGMPTNRCLTATSQGHLPELLRQANNVLTINSATGIIAGAVRESYYLAAEGDPQDDWIVNGTRIVTLP